jgi:hypothetical protein
MYYYTKKNKIIINQNNINMFPLEDNFTIQSYVFDTNLTQVSELMAFSKTLNVLSPHFEGGLNRTSSDV